MFDSNYTLEKDNQLTVATIEQARDGIFWLNEFGKIYMANSAACNFLGYNKYEFLQMNISDIDIDFPKETYSELWKNVKKNGRQQFEGRHKRKDGVIYPVEVVCYYVEFEGRCFLFAFFRDVTEKKEIEKSLREALKELTNLKKKIEEENIYLREAIKSNYDFSDIIGESSALKNVLAQVEQVANTNVSVMIIGETGTGKELVAHAIHNLSNRKDKSFIQVNCATLPATLIESELFGYEKGAFTGANSRKVGRFELSDGGTIFLDEITELPYELQAKLLRVLQEGEFERLGSYRSTKVDVRIIAATNKNPEELVMKGLFREDLYYRLNVFPIEVPPLRDRKEDIPLLVKFFLSKFALKMGKRIDVIPQSTIVQLAQYNWPGNVRELKNIIERGIILSKGNKLEVNLCFRKNMLDANNNNINNGNSFINNNTTLAEKEKLFILQSLELTSWKVSGDNGAAMLLGLKPTTLEAKMKKFGIKRPH